MINNDEYIINSEKEFSEDDFHKFSNRYHSFYNPRIVLSRKIYDKEIEQGLDVKFQGSKFDEKPPEITLLLDAYFRIVKHFSCRLNTNIKSDEFLATYIGTIYYDCMSMGMPHWEIAIMRHIIKKYCIDLNLEVYPNMKSDKWLTLKDFIEETKHIDDIKTLSHLKNLALPSIMI
jgi:hypothetical protein